MEVKMCALAIGSNPTKVLIEEQSKTAGSKYTVNCLSCAPRKKDEHRTLFITEYCRVVFREDVQPFFARIVIFPEEHFSHLLTAEEENPTRKITIQKVLNDIYDCRYIFKIAYKTLFSLSRVNWVEAGNLNKDENGLQNYQEGYHHSHYHFVPRFANPVNWRGQQFVDSKFAEGLSINSNHYTDEEKVKLSKEQIIQLKEDVQLHLVKNQLVSWEWIARSMPSKAVIEAHEAIIKQKADAAKSKATAANSVATASSL